MFSIKSTFILSSFYNLYQISFPSLPKTAKQLKLKLKDTTFTNHNFPEKTNITQYKTNITQYKTKFALLHTTKLYPTKDKH